MLALQGCVASAVVGTAATVTGQAVKTTAKAAGTVTRAAVGGVGAAANTATKPFRKKDEDEPPLEDVPEEDDKRS